MLLHVIKGSLRPFGFVLLTCSQYFQRFPVNYIFLSINFIIKGLNYNFSLKSALILALWLISSEKHFNSVLFVSWLPCFNIFVSFPGISSKILGALLHFPPFSYLFFFVVYHFFKWLLRILIRIKYSVQTAVSLHSLLDSSCIFLLNEGGNQAVCNPWMFLCSQTRRPERDAGQQQGLPEAGGHEADRGCEF